MLLILPLTACTSPLGKTFLCVFSVTQVKISRLNQKQKMEQKQKMGHQGPVVVQGKNTFIIAILTLYGVQDLSSCF